MDAPATRSVDREALVTNQLSIEQQAIVAAGRLLPDSLLVEALAGTGKTSTLIELLKILPQASAIVLAFNTRIADEMTRRKPVIPRGRLVHVKTIHSAGRWVTMSHFPHLVLNKNESERLVDRACTKGTNLRLRGAALKLLRMAKDFQHDPELDADLAYSLGTEFGLFDKLEGGELQTAIEITQRAYAFSLNMAERTEIDFPDMTWLPLVLGLDPPSRYKAVLIDEVQDVSPNQFAMVDMLLAPNGRVIACGDKNQAIYGWRGATPEATWEILNERYKCKPFPLTITWRCDHAIVKQANELVPDLRAREDAGVGRIESCSMQGFYDAICDPEAEGSVFVLSRTNAALLKVALEMWKRRIGFNITQSPEVTWPLKDIVKKLLRGLHHDRPTGSSIAVSSFKQALGAWRITELNKANGAGSSTWAERIEEQFAMLTHCLGYVTDPDEISRLLDTIFSEDEDIGITLSTVHKMKGMEADRVFLLRETFARYRKRFDKERGEMVLPRVEDVPVEEENILYVGITRARHELVYVSIEP